MSPHPYIRRYLPGISLSFQSALTSAIAGELIMMETDKFDAHRDHSFKVLPPPFVLCMRIKTLMELCNAGMVYEAVEVSSPSPSHTHAHVQEVAHFFEPAWQSLHHAPQLLRAIEVALCGEGVVGPHLAPFPFSLRVVGHPDAGVYDLSPIAVACFPAFRWQLPCPCGYCGEPSRECICTPSRVERWRRRCERQSYDLTTFVAIPRAKDLTAVERARTGRCEPFSLIVERASTAALAISSIPLTLDPAGTSLLRAATDKLHLGLHCRDRTIVVARTIAALAHSPTIRCAHLAEALAYQYK